MPAKHLSYPYLYCIGSSIPLCGPVQFTHRRRSSTSSADLFLSILFRSFASLLYARPPLFLHDHWFRILTSVARHVQRANSPVCTSSQAIPLPRSHLSITQRPDRPSSGRPSHTQPRAGCVTSNVQRKLVHGTCTRVTRTANALVLIHRVPLHALCQPVTHDFVPFEALVSSRHLTFFLPLYSHSVFPTI